MKKRVMALLATFVILFPIFTTVASRVTPRWSLLHSIIAQCYIEDNQAVKTLLASLHVRKKELILSRYIVAVAIVIILIIVATLMGLLMGVAINAAVLWMGIVSGILYETIYLLLYYKWGNNVAQYAFVVIIVIIAGASWLLWF